MKMLIAGVGVMVAAVPLLAQSAADGPVLRAAAINATAKIHVVHPVGSIRFVAWDKDSVVVRGTVARPRELYFGASGSGAKFGVEALPANLKFGTDARSGALPGTATLVAYIPRHGTVSVRTNSADIAAEGISGDFFSVSGNIRLSGSATSIEVESMSGSLDLNVSTPWLRARTGDGHLLLRGAPQDADVSTIGGTLDIATQSILRGQFASVSGDIHYAGTPATQGIFEFSNHSGAVDLLMPPTTSAALTLSSIVGRIQNGFTQIRPISSDPRSMKLNLGRGEAQVTVRTFKGTIRLRPQ